MEKMPELSRQADASGSTPLHYISSSGDLRMLRLLLQRDASIAHLSDANGLSALHVAATMGHVHIIQELILISPDSSELVDKRGQNFLHHAVVHRRKQVVRYVLDNPGFEELLNEVDDDRNTPLHLAVTSRNRQIVLMLVGDKRVATKIANHKGLTPLDLASLSVQPSIGLRMYKIIGDLVAAGSKFSPQRLDLLANKQKRNQEEEMNRCRAIVNNLAVVAVLTATVTFAAAFTLPGGYRSDPGSDQGMATLGRRAAFKVFLISDALAMVSSIVVVCLLVQTGSWDHDIRLHSINTSMELMRLALGSMVVAFATGTYVAVASDCRWLAIVICVMACFVPVAVYTVELWPLGMFDAARVGGDRLKRAWNGGKDLCSSGKEKIGEAVDFDSSKTILRFRRHKSINVTDFQTPVGSKSEP